MAFFSPELETLPTAPILPSNRFPEVKSEHSHFLESEWTRAPPGSTVGSFGQPPTELDYTTSTASEFPDYELTQNYKSPGGPSSSGVFERDIEARAQELFNAFLQCPKYFKYRKGIKNLDKDIWPDHVERAFFQALIRFPPCGKQPSKVQGRNVRIALYINHVTGAKGEAKIVKKQVSSHLQTLRGYVCQDPILLGYLIQPKEIRDWNEKRQKKGLPVYAASWKGIHMNSNVVGNCYPSLETRQVGRKGHQYQPWILCDFEMSLRSRDPETADLTPPTHAYCRAASDSQLDSMVIDQRSRCFEVLPELFLNSHPRPINDQIIAVQASIQLLQATKVPDNHELAIYYDIQGPRVSGDPVVDTVTTFYHAGHEIEKQDQIGTCMRVDRNGGTAHYQIPFCSAFWAHKLSRLEVQQEQAFELTNTPYFHSVPTEVRTQIVQQAANAARRATNEIEALTAVQQVTIYSTLAPEEKHHITLRWQFKASPHNEVAWRYVQLPPTHDTARTSPLPSPTQTLLSDPSDGGRSQYSAHTPDLPFLHSPVAIHPAQQWDGCFGGAAADYNFPADPAPCFPHDNIAEHLASFDARLGPEPGWEVGASSVGQLDPWLAAQGVVGFDPLATTAAGQY